QGKSRVILRARRRVVGSVARSRRKAAAWITSVHMSYQRADHTIVEDYGALCKQLSRAEAKKSSEKKRFHAKIRVWFFLADGGSHETPLRGSWRHHPPSRMDCKVFRMETCSQFKARESESEAAKCSVS